MMRIGVDIDDVLFPWFDKAHAACERAGITNGRTAQSWVMYEDYGCTKDEWVAALTAATLDGTLHTGDPYPGVVDALEALRDAGHTIHLVTARGFMDQGDLIKERTVRWVAEHGIPHDTLTFSQDKTIARVDLFVDDSERNIAQLTAAGIPCCLVAAHHNAHVEHPWRVITFVEFADDVLAGRVCESV